MKGALEYIIIINISIVHLEKWKNSRELLRSSISILSLVSLSSWNTKLFQPWNYSMVWNNRNKNFPHFFFSRTVYRYSSYGRTCDEEDFFFDHFCNNNSKQNTIDITLHRISDSSGQNSMRLLQVWKYIFLYHLSSYTLFSICHVTDNMPHCLIVVPWLSIVN